MKYDVVVIGGGPAGMMAAGRAGEMGAKVILLEKNSKLGVKLLMTGGGRCNITNQIINPSNLVDIYGKNGKFLFSALNNFGVNEVINFFQNRGVEIKTENNNRIFPESNNAYDILKALKKYLFESEVEIRTNITVKKIISVENFIKKIILVNGEEVVADKYIVCVGGKSYPITGSTGDGYVWLKKIGHEIINPVPALFSIVVKNKIVKNLEGLSLKNIKITLLNGGKKIITNKGEIVFTSNGLSGPLVLNLSRVISRLSLEKIFLQLDFYPDYSIMELDQKIQTDFKNNNNKIFKNFLNNLLPLKLVTLILKILEINPMKQVNSINKEERKKLITLLKNFNLEVLNISDFNKAMITSGGVKLSEINSKTMRSKLIDNLYLAGEILDLDGPTGGYNLQICWSTGYQSGESAGFV